MTLLFTRDVDRGLFEKLPLESQSSSLSSLVTFVFAGCRLQIQTVSFMGLGRSCFEFVFQSMGSPIYRPAKQGVFKPVAFEFDPVDGGNFPARLLLNMAGKTALVIQVTTPLGARSPETHGKYYVVIRHLWFGDGRDRPQLRRQKTGETSSRSTASTPAAFLIRRSFKVFPRQGQRRKMFLTELTGASTPRTQFI